MESEAVGRQRSPLKEEEGSWSNKRCKQTPSRSHPGSLPGLAPGGFRGLGVEGLRVAKNTKTIGTLQMPAPCGRPCF